MSKQLPYKNNKRSWEGFHQSAQLFGFSPHFWINHELLLFAFPCPYFSQDSCINMLFLVYVNQAHRCLFHSQDNPRANIIIYHLYGHMQLRKGHYPNVTPAAWAFSVYSSSLFIAGCGVCCRMCTTPVLSSCTSGSSVPLWTMMTTSAWWMWTADLASSSAATPQPNAWSSTGSSLRWRRATQPHARSDCRRYAASLAVIWSQQLGYGRLNWASVLICCLTRVQPQSSLGVTHWNCVVTEQAATLQNAPWQWVNIDLQHALIWAQNTSYCCLLSRQCGVDYRFLFLFQSWMCFILDSCYDEYGVGCHFRWVCKVLQCNWQHAWKGFMCFNLALNFEWY